MSSGVPALKLNPVRRFFGLGLGGMAHRNDLKNPVSNLPDSDVMYIRLHFSLRLQRISTKPGEPVPLGEGCQTLLLFLQLPTCESMQAYAVVMRVFCVAVPRCDCSELDGGAVARE